MKAIKTVYLGPTNTKGSRVKASAEGGSSVILAWDHALDAVDNHKAAAKALCEKLGWTGKLATGGLSDCYVHVFTGE